MERGDVVTLFGAHFLEVRVWYRGPSVSCINIFPSKWGRNSVSVSKYRSLSELYYAHLESFQDFQHVSKQVRVEKHGRMPTSEHS